MKINSYNSHIFFLTNFYSGAMDHIAQTFNYQINSYDASHANGHRLPLDFFSWERSLYLR